MKPFSRTVEKVLAWIANVLLILLTGVLVYIVFFKTELIRNNPDIIQQAEQIFASNPKTANLTPEQRMDLMIASFITYVVIYINYFRGIFNEEACLIRSIFLTSCNSCWGDFCRIVNTYIPVALNCSNYVIC